MESGRVASKSDAAFEACARLANTHYENFTVGSLLLPRGTKKHLHALYAFARTTDDIGDESEGDRLANLDAWEEDFRRIRDGSPRHPVHVALVETVRKFDIPDEPFLKLIEANRIDQRKTRHETFKDLLHYCDHSANPCGHLVLYAFGERDAESRRLADFTCTALQLVNFWQDLATDWSKGRVYLPQEDLRRFGYTEEELGRGEVNDRLRLVSAECVGQKDGVPYVTFDKWTPSHGPAVACDEIVVDDRLESRRSERFAGMAADEPGAARYEYST